jgi:hypothetical protein
MQATNDQCTDLQITELSAAERPPNDLPPVVAITVLVAVFVVVPLIYG